jgi:Arc/MetJ-type ribon-helix-helix transcriptional regulator
MKLSVSVSEADLAVLDSYVERTGLPSRSAGVQRAIRMLRFPTLEDDYSQAWDEWSESGEDDVWDEATGDGLADAAR